MKSTIPPDISIETNNSSTIVKSQKSPLLPSPSNAQLSSSTNQEYPRNYFELFRAIYENSSLLGRRIQEQSSARKFESFKENIVGNQAINNGNSNQHQHQRKNININIKSESDNSPKDSTKTAGGERSLGNIIINSLDVSIKTHYDGDYGNINKVRISCSTSPPKASVPLPCSSPAQPSPDNHQLVTSSSGDEDNGPLSSGTGHENNNNSASRCINNIDTTRAAFSQGVELSKTVPDDISFDYHNIKHYSNHDGKHTRRSSSTTCNNNSTKYPNGDDGDDDDVDTDEEDYHTKGSASSMAKTTKCNKHNNSSGDIKPITSTYLLMTRSMGLTDEDALNMVSG